MEKASRKPCDKFQKLACVAILMGTVAQDWIFLNI